MKALVLNLINWMKDSTVNTTQIQNDILQIRDVVIKKLLEENRVLRNRVKSLESRVVKVERSMNLFQQNSRKNNLEFDGIPDSVTQEKLVPLITKMVNALDIKCTEDDIEVAHRLKSKKSPKTTIIRAKRNLLEKIVRLQLMLVYLRTQKYMSIITCVLT